MTPIDTVPRPRRNVELVLLVLALAVGIGAQALVGVDRQKAFDTDFWFQSGLLALAALAFHVVLRIRAKYADPVILPLVVALNGLGLAMIHRLDRVGEDTGNNQLRWTLVAMGVAIAVIWFLKDHRILRRFTYISLAISAVLLILPLVPGISAGEVLGASVWIKIGSMTFQPGEIAKITLAIFFAGYLSSNRDLILLAGRKIGPVQFPRFKDMGPMITAWLVSIGVLVFQRDLGSSILFFGLFLVMIYVATSRISWVIIGLVLIIVGGFVAARVFSHVALRIDGWLNAFTDEVYGRQFGGSLQIVEGLFGMANGGLVGTGLGQGRPNLVPFANSDMIIASFGEELGLIGVFAIVLMYLLLFTRGFRAALGTRDAFGKLLATGLSFAIALQCFVVIGGVTRLIPLTGLTTPFLAAGGSSLLANWIIVGLLLMISHTARGPVDTTPLPPGQEPGVSQETPRDAVQAGPGPPNQSRRTHRGGETAMNQAIRNSWIAAIAMFVLIFGALSYVQVVGADELKANAWNRRAILQNYCNDRGAIIVGGSPVAESVPATESCKFQRTYSQPELYAGITGYFSKNYGLTGLEKSMNDVLAGSSDQQFLDRVGQLFLGNQPKGASVELTLDPKIQKLAYDLIPDGQRGSIVVTNPKTGAVLAMVSKPSYDPNLIATQDRGCRTGQLQRAEPDPGDQPQPECQRPHRGVAGTRFGLQAHRHGRGPELGQVQQGQRPAQPGGDVLPRHRIQAPQLRGRQLLYPRDGVVRVCPAAVLQYAVRQHRPGPRAEGHRGPGGEVRLRAGLRRPAEAGQRPELLPERSAGRRRARAVLDRPAGRPGHPAPDQHDDGRDRQRRRADAAEPDQGRTVPGPAGDQRAQAAGAAHRHDSGDRAADQRVDGQRRRRRHRQPRGRARCPGGRQDRYRGARQRPEQLMVYRVCPGE